MAIQTELLHIVACDECGEKLDAGDSTSYFPTEGQALDYARDLGCWWIGDDDTVLCDLWNDEHEAKAREIAATLDSDDFESFLDWIPQHVAEPIARAHDEATPRYEADMPGQTAIPIGT